MKHNQKGNCFDPAIIYECTKCGTDNFCDVDHGCEQVRGDCQTCPSCLQCKLEEV